MPNPVFVGASDSGKIYRVGRIGLDSGTQDSGGVYTGSMKTEKFSPAGPDGLALFRRVYVRVHHTGSAIFAVLAFVDNVQTKRFSAGSFVNQEALFTLPAPLLSPAETVVEMAISAQGTSIEVRVDVVSSNVSGIFLIEGVSVGCQIIRESKQRGAITV